MGLRPAKGWAFIPLAAASLALASPPSAAGQTPVADDPRVQEALDLLDVWVDARVDYESIPGASLAVIHDQELVWSEGYGYAHVDAGVPATPETMYSICSISKLFTSVSLMRLRDEGRLTLRDPVGQHLDWFDIEETFTEAGPITVEGILTHSSGLPREADAPYWTGPDYPFPTHEEIVERLSSQETLYPARTHYQYSNLGLTLAGEMVAELSGMPWDEYVHTRILAPLGMENTATEHLDELRGGQLATGYSALRRDGTRAPIPPYEIRGIGPAAGMLSTVEDLGRFASWQFRTLEGMDEGILDRNTLREMYRVHWMEPDAGSTRGLGFGVWQSDGKTFVGHGGSCPGYESHLLLRPQEKIATTFMTNGRRVSASSFTRGTYRIVAEAISAAVDDPGGGEAPDSTLTRFTGYYERPLGTESAVLTWKGELVVIGLPTSDPLGSMTRLRHVDGGSFRRVRSDGELGEEWLFQEEADGTMRLWVHGNYRDRVARD